MSVKEHKCTYKRSFIFKEGTRWFILADDTKEYARVEIIYCPWCGVKLDGVSVKDNEYYVNYGYNQCLNTLYGMTGDINSEVYNRMVIRSRFNETSLFP